MNSESDSSILSILFRFVQKAEIILSKETITKGALKMWTGGLRSQIKKIYGEDHEVISSLTDIFKETDRVLDIRIEFENRLNLLKSYISK